MGRIVDSLLFLDRFVYTNYIIALSLYSKQFAVFHSCHHIINHHHRGRALEKILILKTNESNIEKQGTVQYNLYGLKLKMS